MEKKKEARKPVDGVETAAENAVAEAAAGEETAGIRQALEEKTAEAAANYEKFLRERADLENMRKRFQKEKDELLKYGNERLILEILPAVDNLERAIEHSSGEASASIVEGIAMTLSMLLSSLKKFGVTPIQTGGEQFNPDLHQAMSRVETADVPPNTVFQEFQKGYLLNDRLLRPAMVSVAAAPRVEEE